MSPDRPSPSLLLVVLLALPGLALGGWLLLRVAELEGTLRAYEVRLAALEVERPVAPRAAVSPRPVDAPRASGVQPESEVAPEPEATPAPPRWELAQERLLARIAEEVDVLAAEQDLPAAVAEGVYDAFEHMTLESFRVRRAVASRDMTADAAREAMRQTRLDTRDELTELLGPAGVEDLLARFPGGTDVKPYADAP